MSVRYVVMVPAVALAALATGLLGLLAAPAAQAECVYTDGLTVCTPSWLEPSVEGTPTDAPNQPAYPYVPAPCSGDWLCEGYLIDQSGPLH